MPYISTGDIFRYNTKNETELGQEVEKYLSSGSLVPDELTNEIVENRLKQPDCEVGFVLDGYPRNKVQQEFLHNITTVDHAFVIQISDEEAIKRLSKRLACKCGLSYHTQFNPPKEKGICDKCGGELYRREDDKPEAIKHRLAIYHQETESLYQQYKEQGILHKIDGEKSIEEVYKQIESFLE